MAVSNATKAFDAFLETYQAKYPKATECLAKDRDELLAFYDFPAEHWKHLRTTNPIESTFATIRLRHRRTKGNGSRRACLAMMFKLAQRRRASLAHFSTAPNYCPMSSKESLSKTEPEAIKPPPDEFPRTQDLTIAHFDFDNKLARKEEVHHQRLFERHSFIDERDSQLRLEAQFSQMKLAPPNTSGRPTPASQAPSRDGLRSPPRSPRVSTNRASLDISAPL